MTDSFYASYIINLGIINTLLLMTVLVILLFKFVKSQNKEKLIFLSICSLIALTTSITESYPMNLIFSVLVAYYIDPGDEKEQYSDKQLLHK